jgi:regulator of protease activity HflC (stomatin/prohibitin superfamily)
MPENSGILIALVVLAALAATLLFKSVRVVPEYQRLVVFRLGRAIGPRGPGLVLLIPFIDRAVRKDLRETYFELPPQTTITRDNANLLIDFLVYSKIIDVMPSVLNVQDHVGASRGIAITTLRAVVGSMLLDDVLAKREEINVAMREKLDEVTNRWGIKVTAVEIREVTPPREIMEAMTRQMSAERTRRATILEAEGRRDATVRLADGQRQAAILEAEGARQASVLRAEGFAAALDRIFAVARHIDSKTIILQYLETLKAMAASPANKLVLPVELTSLLRPFLAYAAGATGDHEEPLGKEPERSPH